MDHRRLPARPSLEHLKNEAKALHKSGISGNVAALERFSAALGTRHEHKLTDAQRVIAREYGFPTWAALRSHVQSSRGVDEAALAFLSAANQQDLSSARRLLAAEPRIASSSIHVAATLGDTTTVLQLLDADPAAVSQRAGNPAGEPLIHLCSSPFHGESEERDRRLLECARLLLERGADPNAKESRYGVSALYFVTGMKSVLPIARLLLEAGATPDDGESVFHAAEHYHLEALELLLSAGADLNHVGDWGNTPLYFLLRYWKIEPGSTVERGMNWLLAHGADPNVKCGKVQEGSLHVAARRGQSAEVIQRLVEHGADVNAERGDGRTPWLLAARSGFTHVVDALERSGAQPRPLNIVDQLLEACGRGERDRARALATPEVLAQLNERDLKLLAEAVSEGRSAAALAFIGAGFPVNEAADDGGTPLHHAAIHGNVAVAEALLDAEADITVRDPEHNATPLGWCFFGADHIADATGDYAGVARALLGAGATLAGDELLPEHSGVRAALAEAAEGP